jgi:D-serine deaminase-like pyridoxal phosphate-dependent protein
MELNRVCISNNKVCLFTNDTGGLPMTRGDEVIRVVKLLFYRSTGSTFIR